ncbi:hypothetical protein CULT_1330016 [[Clostridium] ultunense Esp]|nr:hypothetical protein CULT_1330016 [[Clostridium] ultunense Esp]
MIRPVYYVEDHTVLTALYYGPKIYLDPRDIIQANIMYYGFWEKWVSDAFLDCLKPGMTVLDIGAHCGYYSLLAAMKVGKSGKVHAFEPNAKMVENVKKSLMINGFRQVDWHPLALSDQAGTARLLVPETGGGALIATEASEHQQVDTVILSDYLPEFKADVIKIDVDGSEPRILNCLYKLIERSDHPTIFMEYCPVLWRMQRFDPKERLQDFIHFGYAFYVLEHNGNRTSIDFDQLIAFDRNEHLDLLIKKA